MNPVFKLAAITLPDIVEENLYEYDQNGRRSLGIQVDFQASTVKPQSSDRDQLRRLYKSRRLRRIKQPTLGILSGGHNEIGPSLTRNRQTTIY